MRPSPRFLFASLGLAAALAAPLAMAQTPDAPPQTDTSSLAAQARFDRGRALFQDRDYERALAEFRASLELYRSPNTRLYVGVCLKELSRFAEAYTELSRTVLEATDLLVRDRHYESTRDRAQLELQSVEGHVGFVTVRAPGAPATARLRLGAEALGAAALGVRLPRDPGPVSVDVVAEGFRPFHREVTVAAGASDEVVVELEALPAQVVTPLAPRPTVTTTTGGGVRVAGFVIGAVGLASLGAFAALGSMTSSRYDDLVAACRTRCPPSRVPDIDAGESMQLGANIALGVGVGAVVLGVILVAAGGPRTVTVEQPERATLWVDPTHGSVGVRGAF